jgi:uncharacterized damage-inducible protein DinB
MITPDYARTMTAYNAEMNRRLYAAVAGLPEEVRRADRGAFWGSIHGTLNHLLWGDLTWMSRFAGWPAPGVSMKESPALHADFGELRAAREAADAGMIAWAGTLDPAWLDGDLGWYSGALGRQMAAPRALLLTHLFNHQTHHRGQVHALLTAAGAATGDTDLFVIAMEQAG